jgi:hypothetical protein
MLLVQAGVVVADHFLHQAEVDVAFKGLDLEAAVAGLVGLAVNEAHHRRDREHAGDVQDVKALCRCWRMFEPEGSGEQGQGARFVATGQEIFAEEVMGLLRCVLQRVKQVA